MDKTKKARNVSHMIELYENEIKKEKKLRHKAERELRELKYLETTNEKLEYIEISQLIIGIGIWLAGFTWLLFKIGVF